MPFRQQRLLVQASPVTDRTATPTIAVSFESPLNARGETSKPYWSTTTSPSAAGPSASSCRSIGRFQGRRSSPRCTTRAEHSPSSAASTSERCRSTVSAPLRRHHRVALPLLAPSFSNLRIAADVVICSSSGWAHGATVEGRKVVYCHTPARWLYQSDRYLRESTRPVRAVASFSSVKAGAMGQAGGGVRRLLSRQLHDRRRTDQSPLRHRCRSRSAAAGDNTTRPDPTPRRRRAWIHPLCVSASRVQERRRGCPSVRSIA